MQPCGSLAPMRMAVLCLALLCRSNQALLKSVVSIFNPFEFFFKSLNLGSQSFDFNFVALNAST
jgi:hypothetical protein